MNEITIFDKETQLYYRFIPTATWPTFEISGIRMHRTKDADPKKDTELKLKTIAPIKGIVLDTCTGLGYTAILSAKQENVKKVITVEKDKNVIYLQKQNKFSEELFTNRKIERIEGNVQEVVTEYEDNYFDAIIHDPPSMKIAGELYSEDFYRQLFRVLKTNGKMFHYTGSPGIKSGKDIVSGVIRRLQRAGFRNVKRVESALGVAGIK